MRRAYKFRAYPTRPQESRAGRLLADHCDLYNAALEERREAWRMQRATITYGIQSAQLKDIRACDQAGQGRHSFTAQQQTLRRLGVVFQAFYDRCRAGQRPGYPRFKPCGRFGQVMFVNGDGAKWSPAGGDMIWVNPADTSTDCYQCGRRCTRPRQDTVICAVHGPMDADVNGARNICAMAGLGSGHAAPAA